MKTEKSRLTSQVLLKDSNEIQLSSNGVFTQVASQIVPTNQSLKSQRSHYELIKFPKDDLILAAMHIHLTKSTCKMWCNTSCVELCSEGTNGCVF